jgi:hypothetical protein
LNAIGRCPRTNGGWVIVDRTARSAAAIDLCGASGATTCSHPPGEGFTQFAGMPGVEVNLVVHSVEPETDGLIGSRPIEIIDKFDRDTLSHRCFLSFQSTKDWFGVLATTPNGPVQSIPRIWPRRIFIIIAAG